MTIGTEAPKIVANVMAQNSAVPTITAIWQGDNIAVGPVVAGLPVTKVAQSPIIAPQKQPIKAPTAISDASLVAAGYNDTLCDGTAANFTTITTAQRALQVVVAGGEDLTNGLLHLFF